MDFTNIRQHYNELLSHLKDAGYTESYIRRIRDNIRWMLKNEEGNTWDSYVDVYCDRVLGSESYDYKRNQRVAFGAIQRFDISGEYPDRITKPCLIKKGAYYQLIPDFMNLIDSYTEIDKLRDLKEHTIKGNASRAANFLLAMQEKGRYQLSDICEDDVLSFFLDDKGNLSKCSSYKKQIAAVFKTGTGRNEKECRRILAYLPKIRPKRKNIQYLTPDETDEFHKLLDDDNHTLTLRNRAIATLLYFTGIRACDIAEMQLSAIDWGKDEIRLPQQKTGAPLILPLTAAIGNALYDYIAIERPESSDPHLFLSELFPHPPITASALWTISARIYKAANLRQNANDRRGTHLFRFNVATSFLGNGVPRPVISQTLGHTDPLSLDAYLHADLVHLKECALSIEAFPVSEEVFRT